MMDIVFRSEAAEDLRQIIAWYDDVAPDSVSRIVADIYRSIDQLSHYPDQACRCPTVRFAGS